MVVVSPTMSLTHWHLVTTKFNTTTPDYVRVYFTGGVHNNYTHIQFLQLQL